MSRPDHKDAVQRPARGLPEHLPAGEALLWQGSPNWRVFLTQVFHVRMVAAYFGFIIAVCTVIEVREGWAAAAIATACFHKALLASVPLLLMALYAWGVGRTTIYSITSKRIVFSFGMALPMSYNIPFSRLDAAGLRIYSGGAGDIPVQLRPDEKLGYMVLWPHARPWRMARTEPMIRCVDDVATASGLLAEAFAAHMALGGERAPVRKAVRLGVKTGSRAIAVAAE